MIRKLSQNIKIKRNFEKDKDGIKMDEEEYWDTAGGGGNGGGDISKQFNYAYSMTKKERPCANITRKTKSSVL